MSIRLKRFLLGRLPQTAITITEVALGEENPDANVSLLSSRIDGTTSRSVTSSHLGANVPTAEPSAELLSHSNHVGRRLMVWWPKDQAFYNGVIARFHSESGLHEVLYDDGDKELLRLASERLRWHD